MTNPDPVPQDATTMPLGELIDTFWALRETHKQLTAAVKTHAGELTRLEEIILSRLDAEKSTLARGHTASASVSEVTVANVDDWETFHSYIRDNDAFYLLERRPANRACREIFDTGASVPGVSPFVKRSINVRTL